jgi:hypothetical protein
MKSSVTFNAFISKIQNCDACRCECILKDQAQKFKYKTTLKNKAIYLIQIIKEKIRGKLS